MPGNLKEKILSNLIWRFAERCGAQLVAFVVSVVLARMLEPGLYGTVALMSVFIAIVQVFVDSGLGNALIQKKDADDLDFSSVFYTNIVVCLLMYALLFVLSPCIAKFYDDLTMVSMIRVLGLTVIISGIKNVQQAYVSRHLLFKKFFYSTLTGTICAGIVGVVMAYKGFGAWALVAQQITNTFIDTLVLWITVKWRPIRKFSIQRMKQLFSFGWKLLASSLIDVGYNNLRSLIIGKIYTSADLAYYDKGERLPTMVISNINTSIDSVILPVMSKEQNDRIRVKEMLRRSIKVSIYVLAPCMMGLFFVADFFIKVLLTEKWIDSVFFMRIFCITLMFWPVHNANLNAIKAVGRSDIFLKLEIIKKVIGIVLLVSTMRISVKAMALSMLVATVTSLILNIHPNKELLDYGLKEQLCDIIPSIILATLMGCIVYPIKWIEMPMIIVLIVQIITGIIIYIIGSRIFKIEAFYFLWDMIKPFVYKERS